MLKIKPTLSFNNHLYNKGTKDEHGYNCIAYQVYKNGDVVVNEDGEYNEYLVRWKNISNWSQYTVYDTKNGNIVDAELIN